MSKSVRLDFGAFILYNKLLYQCKYNLQCPRPIQKLAKAIRQRMGTMGCPCSRSIVMGDPDGSTASGWPGGAEGHGVFPPSAFLKSPWQPRPLRVPFANPRRGLSGTGHRLQDGSSDSGPATRLLARPEDDGRFR